jgi:hypothetical protein
MKRAMKKTIGDIFIAGRLTAEDWKASRTGLKHSGDPVLWNRAFEDYFYTRLSLRYLAPIKVLQDHDTYRGEGFSIMVIQCSVVEFLESTVQGMSYCFRRGEPAPGTYEYSNSSGIFLSFLVNRTPFRNDFNDETARSFYEGVRCGLLHEARTKNGWTILAKSTRGHTIDGNQKIVYRDNFQAALLAFVEWYRAALPTDYALQEAFIRKFDSLCL